MGKYWLTDPDFYTRVILPLAICFMIVVAVFFVRGYAVSKSNAPDNSNLPVAEEIGRLPSGKIMYRLPAEGGWVYVVNYSGYAPGVCFVPKEK